MTIPMLRGRAGRSPSIPTARRLLRIPWALALLALPVARPSAAQQRTDTGPAPDARARVGPLGDGRIVVPTNQVLAPAGRQVDFRGRPTDLALHPDGRLLAVLNTRSNEVLTIVVPQFVSRHRWHNLLHAQTAAFLRLALMFRRGIVITSVPYHVREDARRGRGSA